MFDDEDLRQTIMVMSVKKRPWDNYKVIAPVLWRQSRKDATYIYMYTHTHLFNGPLSGTTQVRRYQKGKTNLDFTEARDSEWL